MSWKFDQAPNVAGITCQSVIEGHPVRPLRNCTSYCHSRGEQDELRNPILCCRISAIAVEDMLGYVRRAERSDELRRRFRQSAADVMFVPCKTTSDHDHIHHL